MRNALKSGLVALFLVWCGVFSGLRAQHETREEMVAWYEDLVRQHEVIMSRWDNAPNCELPEIVV